MESISDRGIGVLALTHCPVCRRLEVDMKGAFKGGGYSFIYMDKSMTPARVGAIRTHVANRYAHHTVPIVFENGSFVGGSEAVYRIMDPRSR